MAKPKMEKPIGANYPMGEDEPFQLLRFTPSEELQFFVEYFWIVKWDVESDGYKQENLSNPSVQLVFEKGNTWIWGVITGKFKRSLKDEGKIMGVKFRPGAFYPFYQSSVSAITDGVLAFEEVFDADLALLEEEILSPDSMSLSLERIEQFLIANLPDKDKWVGRIHDIMDVIMKDCELIKVEQLVDRLEMSKRSLQRLFKWYVGIPPTWVIKRFRLHEVASKIAKEEGKAKLWPELALELGYDDQAHFIKDFKSVVGQTPAEYARSVKA